MRRVSGLCFFILCGIIVSSARAQDNNADYVVAKLGEEKVYFSEIARSAEGLNRFLKENFQISKDWRLNYIRQYIARRSLGKRAERQGLDKNKDILSAFAQARVNILADKILGDELDKIKISEEEIKKYYEANKSKYQNPEKIKISYIKIKSKEEANKLIEQINKGRVFNKLGKKITQSKSLFSKGAPPMGEGLENVPAPAWDEIFALGVGGTSQSIQVATAYYIFHIEAKEAAQDRPWVEVRPQAEFDYSRDKKEKIINNFILETFQQEKVQIYEDEIIKNFTAANK